MFSSLLAAFALAAGRWLQLSRRRRNHPPRHAGVAAGRPGRGQHRLPRGEIPWV
jgi:hypothetical protein